MASSTVKFTWCSCRNYKIQSKDTHDKCLLCLGIQHAKEAVLEYGKCPHCAKMDWSTCIKRLTKVQEVIHQEAQQRKNVAQTSIRPSLQMAAVASASVKETQSVEVAAPSTSQTETIAPAPCSSTVPVMFTLLTPSPGLSEPNAVVVQGAYVSNASLQRTPDPAPSAEHRKPAQTLASGSHKRPRSSRCHSCCKRQTGCRRKRKRSPASTSSSLSSSETTSETVKERKVIKSEQQHGCLLEMVQQKLEAQQKAVEVQWSMMEKRLELLERRTSGDAGANSAEMPQVFTISQGQQTGPSTSLQTGSVPSFVTIKQEDEPVAISSPAEDLLTSKDLQDLIGRAARHLGIEFPRASSDDPRPIVTPEFEDLIQMTWSNPASSEAFRPEFSDLYRLHEVQAPAYDRMPQVDEFMSAIFQVIQPTRDEEPAAGAKLWKPTQDLVEKAYRSAAMLAKTANYLRYLSDYQKGLLAEVSQDPSPQRLTDFLRELGLIGRFTSQLSSHQAELSGRIMAASVAVSRQVWMAKSNRGDSLRATVSDLPFVAGPSVRENGASSSGDGTCRPET